MARNIRRTIADIRCGSILFDFAIPIRIGERQVEVVVDSGLGFQLDTPDADLADLPLQERGNVGRHIGLGKVEECRGKETVKSIRLVFETDLELLAFLRLQ
ncbi:hypothetical protein D3C72_1937750 [compost metagenome]